MPLSLPDLIGHKTSIEQLYNWLKEWGKQPQYKDDKKKNTFMMMQLGRFQVTGDKQ